MAKFKDDNLDLETNEHIDFDDANTIQMGYDGSELYINSTVSGVRAAQPHHMVRYDQLVEVSGTLASGTDEFIELIDTPNTYSGAGGYTLQVSETEDGIAFVEAPAGTIVSGTTPPDSTDVLWYNNMDHIIYYYDADRSKWLSSSIINYLFTYSGNIDGLYLSVGNVVDSYAHYNLSRDACIIAISADQSPSSSNTTKGYEVQEDQVSVFSWNMVANSYTSTTLDVDLSQGGELQAYCSDVGARARDPIVSIELRWRYDST